MLEALGIVFCFVLIIASHAAGHALIVDGHPALAGAADTVGIVIALLLGRVIFHA